MITPEDEIWLDAMLKDTMPAQPAEPWPEWTPAVHDDPWDIEPLGPDPCETYDPKGQHYNIPESNYPYRRIE